MSLLLQIRLSFMYLTERMQERKVIYGLLKRFNSLFDLWFKSPWYLGIDCNVTGLKMQETFTIRIL